MFVQVFLISLVLITYLMLKNKAKSSWLTAETDSWLVVCVYGPELDTTTQLHDHEWRHHHKMAASYPSDFYLISGEGGDVWVSI